ncbi:Alpha/Beta hydrolase protein [Hypoxylon argillaceum]|nr:Alpha/Beta hydrolase protein [Hypoxylon argillaceum]
MAYAVPQPAVALPPCITFESIRLDTKPTACLECSRVQGISESGYPDILVVFLNGLIAPQSFWLPIMALMLRRLKMGDADAGNDVSRPEMLAYDRYGQGRTIDRDPSDEGREEGYGHDTLDVVRDLHQLISQATQRQHSDSEQKRIMFVANSIGCAIARLYAEQYPRVVAGMLLLDSIMANSDFVSIFPDPESPDFDPGSLPQDVTPEMLCETRHKFREVFHPSVKNSESLDRRNLAALLPDADSPSLDHGFGGKAPFVSVVGHDPEWFAQESLRGSMETPISISMNYTNPTWHRYNQGLTKITSPEKASGPLIAKRCGHFIQRDDPTFVAELALRMLDSIVKDL